MFSLNLSGIQGDDSTQASARRVAPTPRENSRVSKKLEQDVLGEDDLGSSDDDSLDSLNLLDLEESSSEDYSSDSSGDVPDDSSDDSQSEASTSLRGQKREEADDDNGVEARKKAVQVQAEGASRPPRLSLPALPSLPSVHAGEADQPGQSAAAEPGSPNARPGRSALRHRDDDGTRSQTIKVDLLTPCFELTISDSKDAAEHVAARFGVQKDRVRTILHDEERMAVELVGSSFSLAKLEEKMAENSALNAKVAELERKLMTSESLRLKAHRALQELRREVDALEKFVVRK
jgi:hypothetical protein